MSIIHNSRGRYSRSCCPEAQAVLADTYCCCGWDIRTEGTVMLPFLYVVGGAVAELAPNIPEPSSGGVGSLVHFVKNIAACIYHVLSGLRKHSPAAVPPDVEHAFQFFSFMAAINLPTLAEVLNSSFTRQ